MANGLTVVKGGTIGVAGYPDQFFATGATIQPNSPYYAPALSTGFATDSGIPGTPGPTYYQVHGLLVQATTGQQEAQNSGVGYDTTAGLYRPTPDPATLYPQLNGSNRLVIGGVQLTPDMIGATSSGLNQAAVDARVAVQALQFGSII